MAEKLQNLGKPRRGREDGSVFQRCERQYGCPDRVPVLDGDGQPVLNDKGKPELVRPEHKCRGMWVGQVQIGWTGNRREYKRVYARTQRDANKKLADLKKEIARTGGQLPEKTLTVRQWATYWIDNVCKVGPGTKPTYRGYLDKWIIPYLGRHRLERLQAEHVRELYTTMAEKGAQGSRPQTHAILRKLLNDAAKEKGLQRNAASIAGTPAGAGGKRPGHTAEEARAILSHVADHRLGSRWAMALMSGQRKGECLGLEWDRVDLDAGTLDVSWQLQQYPYAHGCGQVIGKTWPCGRKRGGSCPQRHHDLPDGFEHRHLEGSFYLVRPKSQGGYRVIPMVPWLVSALRKRHDEYLKERSAYEVDYNLVWCTETGRPIDEGDDLDAWKDVERAAGTRVLDLHAARHATATLLRDAGVDITVIEAILGHADATTSRGYMYTDLRAKRDALERVAKAITPG